MWGTLCDIGRFRVERPSLLRPCSRRPDFDKPAGADDDHVLAKPRILTELQRHDDSTATIKCPDIGTRKSEAGEFPGTRRIIRLLRNVARGPFPFFGRVNNDAVVVRPAEDDAVDERHFKARGNSDPALRIDSVLVFAGKDHLVFPVLGEGARNDV